MFLSINTNEDDSLKKQMTEFSTKTRFDSKAADGGPHNCFPSPPVAPSARARRVGSGESVAGD